MLDWQNKKWIKVIAVILVITFMAYDIAWATDFSPIQTHPVTLQFLPKITGFISNISNKIFNKSNVREKEEETEISFRSQLVPSKKYEERSGFMRLETMKDMIKRQMEEMNRRQNVESERVNSIYNQWQVNRNQYIQNTEKGQSAQAIQNQVIKARGEAANAAAAAGEFSYVLNKDGSRINYTDGLPSSIENEAITDSYGYKSIKNTQNMRYNGNRLLISYDAEVIDALGNVTKIQWRDAVYSPDSVWWADNTSNAGKYLLGYTEIITDPQGTTTIREWATTRDSYGSDKKFTSYHEITKNALGEVFSTSDWSNPTYDGDNLTGYHQKTEDAYGNIYITDSKTTFNKSNRVTSVVSKDQQINIDLSTSESESVTTYEYDVSDNLVSAVGKTTVKGDDGFANAYSGTTDYSYSVINGQIKLVNTVNAMKYDNADGAESTSTSFTEYKYNDKNLLSNVSGFSNTEGLDVFGNAFKSNTIDTYQIIGSQARRIKSVTQNDSEDMFGSTTHSESVVE